MYAMSCTRPGIAFFVGILGRFISNHEKPYWDAEILMRYLKGTLNLGMLCIGYLVVIETFSDAS